MKIKIRTVNSNPSIYISIRIFLTNTTFLLYIIVFHLDFDALTVSNTLLLRKSRKAIGPEVKWQRGLRLDNKALSYFY